MKKFKISKHPGVLIATMPLFFFQKMNTEMHDFIDILDIIYLMSFADEKLLF